MSPDHHRKFTESTLVVASYNPGKVREIAELLEPFGIVVRSAAEWDVLWKAHAGAQAAPAVDLAKNVVAAVFIGTRPTGGYSVEITGTRRDGDALVIEYVQRAPGRGDIVSQALTSPFHIVSLPRHDGPVRFEQRNATR